MEVSQAEAVSTIEEILRKSGISGRRASLLQFLFKKRGSPVKLDELLESAVFNETARTLANARMMIYRLRQHLDDFYRSHPESRSLRFRVEITGSPLGYTLDFIPNIPPLNAVVATSVFLCHSSGDKPMIKYLHQQLAKEGLKPWLDEVDLIAGQDWDAEIKRAVRASDIVLVCISKSSITKEGYVQKEIKFALDVADEKPEGTIYIIPARLEECALPTRLAKWHCVDLFKPDGFEKVCRAIRAKAAKKHAL